MRPHADPNGSCEDLERFWAAHREKSEADYAAGEESYLVGLLPPSAVALSVPEVVRILTRRYGDVVARVLAGEVSARQIPAPTADHTTGDWIRNARVVGINVRTVGSIWRTIHYCMTVPATMNAVHLLPIWEPGVVGSLYGMASWELNAEFFDEELASLFPAMNTVERQLAATIDLLHLTGRAVGMDVIPHTDRFSQMVVASPAHFEWLRREKATIVDHREDLHEEVEEIVYRFAVENGPAGAVPARDDFFTDAVGEGRRSEILFGPPEDYAGRNSRRGQLIRAIHSVGYEPVPATMGPPFRGIEVDPDTVTRDSTGEEWVDYRITRPEPMSRVFGPLARYKLFGRKNDNADWEIDFTAPRTEVWDYVISHYADVQERFGFDFMRGDMSHVQMRPEGVPAVLPGYYDLLGAVKAEIGRRLPSFAYFAETFLSPPGTMAYGNEVDHLEASGAEVTLGDLQSVPVASDEFSQRLRQYLDIAQTRKVTPSLTVMTGDKDDPRFDSFYVAGNEIRLFLALFLTGMPSYVALGFELRDRHPSPVANEYYSKLYVFQVSTGKHRTEGPYRFGSNAPQLLRLERIHRFAQSVLDEIDSERPEWLLPPDPTGGRKVIAWMLEDLVFVANCDTVAAAEHLNVPLGDPAPGTTFLFSTVPDATETAAVESWSGFQIPRMGRGEARVYRLGSAAGGT